MSAISNIHTAIVYEAKGANKSVAQFGQRGIVTIAKKDKDGNYGQHLQQTMFTSIPTLTTNDIDFTAQEIQNACIDYFKGVQNSIVSDNLKAGHKTISSEQLSQNSILAYLSETIVGEKLTQESIANWFSENLAEQIGVALLSKGMSEDKLELSLQAYSKLLSETLSSKVVIPARKAEAIKKALDFADQTNELVIKFQTRIAKSLKQIDMEELLGL